MSDTFSPDFTMIYLTNNLGMSHIYNIVLSELIVIIDLMDICITSHSSHIFLFGLEYLKLLPLVFKCQMKHN